jgi:hypothetical protein
MFRDFFIKDWVGNIGPSWRAIGAAARRESKMCHYVYQMVDVAVIDDPDELARSGVKKPFLLLTFRGPEGTRVAAISTNLAEMIGGCGAGLRLRVEDASAAAAAQNAAQAAAAFAKFKENTGD